MTAKITCPFCKSIDHANLELIGANPDYSHFKCDRCGEYKLSGSLYASKLDPERYIPTDIQKATLSHAVRQATENRETPLFDTYWYKGTVDNQILMPSLSEQAIKFVKLVGDSFITTGGDYVPDVDTCAKIGTIDLRNLNRLITEIEERNWVRPGKTLPGRFPPRKAQGQKSYRLTLDGWDIFEKEKRGEHEGKFGFLALKFNDTDLESFVAEVLKPSILDEFGFPLHDMRDVSEAGLIDNIMRVRIRDCAFVIADLTHDNNGAYWEAGFAEGLGKPVVYICEKSKFEKKKTHFDTNHSTTVTWDATSHDAFKNELIATLQRSLNFRQLKQK